MKNKLINKSKIKSISRKINRRTYKRKNKRNRLIQRKKKMMKKRKWNKANKILIRSLIRSSSCFLLDKRTQIKI